MPESEEIQNQDIDNKDINDILRSKSTNRKNDFENESDSDATTSIEGTYEKALEKLEEIIHNMKVSYSNYIV